MTYLTRPVFEFPIDWASNPSKSFRYDLRQSDIGQALPRYAPLQQHVIETHSLTLLLATPAEIVDLDAFTAALQGRLNGFWLPTPLAAMEILANSSATQFTIKDQNLRDTWQDGVKLHLYFRKEGQAAKAAQVTAVALSGSNELVTVDANVSVDATWEVMRLAYVRLASDDEEAEFEAEGMQVRKLWVEELTTEYLSLETGLTAVWLYRFYTKARGGIASEIWNFTSFDQDVVSTLNGTIGATVFSSKPVTHGALRQTLKGDREETTLQTFWEAANPLTKFLPLDLLEPLWVEIHESGYADPNTTTVRFIGQVSRPQMNGNEISASCAGLLDVLGRQFPRPSIGPRCNNFLFDAWCGLNKATYAAPITIADIDSLSVTVEGGVELEDKPEDYYTYGWIETEEGEKRTILKSEAAVDQGGGVWTVVLKLNVAFLRTEEAMGGTMYPGCDGLNATCRTKFNNLVNRAAFDYVARNLSVRAIEPETANGNKK